MATGTRRKASENPEKRHLEALGRMGAIAVFSLETRRGFPCPREIWKNDYGMFPEAKIKITERSWRNNQKGPNEKEKESKKE